MKNMFFSQNDADSVLMLSALFYIAFSDQRKSMAGIENADMPRYCIGKTGLL